MRITEIISINGSQAVVLPNDFRIGSDMVSIRREGNRVILEPVKPNQWPDGFFDAIYINDVAFSRAEQGALPPVAPLDSE